MNRGSIKPVYMLVGSLFAFNYLISLPREMAHNKAQENARFKIGHH